MRRAPTAWGGWEHPVTLPLRVAARSGLLRPTENFSEGCKTSAQLETVVRELKKRLSSKLTPGCAGFLSWGICFRVARLPFSSPVWMVRAVCVQFYAVRTRAAKLSVGLKDPIKMAAQTSHMESVALSRVSHAPAKTLQKAMELLVYSGQGEAVIAALDEAQQSLDNDNLARLCQQTLDHLRKAPKDVVGEIQAFAAPTAPEPRRVRQKRERDAAEANERRNERRSVAARPLLELLRSRRHEGHVNIKSVEAVLLDAAEDEPLDADAIDSRRLLSCAPSDPVGAWLDAVAIPRPPAAGKNCGSTTLATVWSMRRFRCSTRHAR